jgi:uncharacterized protein YcbX
MTPRLAQIYRYPVKGMTAEALPLVALAAGRRLPGDRRFAIAHGGGGEARGDWMPKARFLMLMRDERLALLEARLDAAGDALAVYRGGKPVARGNPEEPLGRTLLEQFFAAFMKEELRGAPKIVAARDGGFTDRHEPWLSLVNLESVRDLAERIVRRPVDPLRFRANLYLEGVAPWRELDWIGRELEIGPVRLRIAKAIKRCAAINVDPATAARDLNLPLALEQGLGHCHMGIYAEVLNAGEISPGSPLALPADAPPPSRR